MRVAIFEVYPGAALTCWGFNRKGYKTSGNASLGAKLGWHFMGTAHGNETANRLLHTKRLEHRIRL
jgi:hypothetical protein